MSQDYLARIAALEEALRQKDSQLSLVAETEPCAALQLGGCVLPVNGPAG